MRGAGRFTDDVDPSRALEMAVGGVPTRTLACAPWTSQQPWRSRVSRRSSTGADVARRSEPIGILRPRSGRPAIAQLRPRPRHRHLRGTAGRERGGDEPAHRRGCPRAVEIDYEPLAARVRRRCRPWRPARPSCTRMCSTAISSCATRREPETSTPVWPRRTSWSRGVSSSTASPDCRWRHGRSLAEWRPGARELHVHTLDTGAPSHPQAAGRVATDQRERREGAR